MSYLVLNLYLSVMKKLFSLLFVCVSVLLSAQDQDPKAKAILDDLSKITKAYKTITADYSFTILNKEKKPVEKQAHKVQVKGNKFKLDIPGSTIVCDGATLWNYNKDAKEVTIKTFESSNDDQLNPSKIFTMYESGYKFKYDKEEKVGAAVCHVIDLHPSVNPEKKKFHTIKLYVDKVKKQVVKLTMLMKDGGQNVYEIKTFKPNSEIADAMFVFDTKGLKPDQISDER